MLREKGRHLYKQKKRKRGRKEMREGTRKLKKYDKKAQSLKKINISETP